MGNYTLGLVGDSNPSQPAYVYNLIGTIMTFTFIFASIENVVVLSAFIRFKKLRTNTNLWIFALIICDLLIVLSAFPILIITSYAREFILGDFGCKWDGFLVTVLGSASIWLLVGLSVHRYFIMFNPAHSNQATRYKAYAGIVFCFVFGLVWGVCPLVGWGSYQPEGLGLSCAPDWRSRAFNDISFTVAMYTLVLLVPVLVIAYCYCKIIYKVWREKRQSSTWIKQRRVVKEIHVTVSVALIILSFLVSWMPYAIICACESFFGTNFNSVSPLIVQLPCLMAKTACIWNPIVYVARNKSFRKAVLSQFPCFKYEQEESSAYEENQMLGSKRDKHGNEVAHNVAQCSGGSST